MGEKKSRAKALYDLVEGAAELYVKEKEVGPTERIRRFGAILAVIAEFMEDDEQPIPSEEQRRTAELERAVEGFLQLVTRESYVVRLTRYRD